MSSDSGASWGSVFTDSGLTYFASVSISANGRTLVLCAELSWLSTNGGSDWNEIHPYGVDSASSADGTVIAMGWENSFGPDAALFISPNSGFTWVPANGPLANVLITADGSRFAVLGAFGNIYISEPNPPPTLNIAGSGSTLQLSWIPLTAKYLLQQSPDLKSWSPVTNPPQLNITNLQYQLQLPQSPTQTFFRLKSD
jgi:hypothetical protein